jgi:hypothetical protein
LLDRSSIIQTGQTIGSALSNPALKGALQPFIDNYSYLLQYSIEMIYGPDPYNGPRNLDRVTCYTWERKRGGPSGEFQEAASAVV